MNRYWRYTSLLSGLFLLCASPAMAESLTKDQVVELAKMGIGDDAIIAKIQTSGAVFVLTTDDMIALNRRGVSTAVITAMLQTSARAGSPTGTPARFGNLSPGPAQAQAAQPQQLASGIYLVKSSSSSPSLEIIQPQTANYARARNPWAMAFTMGIAKTTLTSEFVGASAETKAQSRRPEFQFYFDIAASSLSAMNQTATTPDDFVLMKLDVRDGNRSVMVGKGNRFGTRGLIRSDGIAFTSTRISDRSYSLVPAQPLEPGEYAFIIVAQSGRGGNAVLAYGFSVP